MNLTTSYLGMTLKNPIVASSSPLSHTVESVRRLEDAGAAAVVMYSLFEERITFDSFYVDYYLTSGTNSFAESLSYFPEMQSYDVQRVCDIFVGRAANWPLAFPKTLPSDH